MATTKFTPGPWEVFDKKVLDYREVYAPESRERHWIARVQDDAGEDWEGLANANLISAAPDLYEALDEITMTPGVVLPKRLLDMAMAALAKAAR